MVNAFRLLRCIVLRKSTTQIIKMMTRMTEEPRILLTKVLLNVFQMGYVLCLATMDLNHGNFFVCLPMLPLVNSQKMHLRCKILLDFFPTVLLKSYSPRVKPHYDALNNGK